MPTSHSLRCAGPPRVTFTAVDAADGTFCVTTCPDGYCHISSYLLNMRLAAPTHISRVRRPQQQSGPRDAANVRGPDTEEVPSMQCAPYSITVLEGQCETWLEVVSSEIRHLCDLERLADESDAAWLPSLALWSRIGHEATSGATVHEIGQHELGYLREGLLGMREAEHDDLLYADSDVLLAIRCEERIEVLDHVADCTGGYLGL